MQRPSNGGRKPKRNAVMYARSVSLAAAHLIGPDANELLKACGNGMRERRGEGEVRDGHRRWRREGR